MPANLPGSLKVAVIGLSDPYKDLSQTP